MKLFIWSLVYWIVCSVAVTIFALDMPPSTLISFILLYSTLAVIIYVVCFLLFFYIPFRRRKKEESEEEAMISANENVRRFKKEQLLRQKYRTLTLKELVADEEVEIEDKLILLQSVHGYTLDEAKKLLKASYKKQSIDFSHEK